MSSGSGNGIPRKRSLFETIFKGKEMKAEEQSRAYNALLQDIHAEIHRFNNLAVADADVVPKEREFLKKRIEEATAVFKSGAGKEVLNQVNAVNVGGAFVYKVRKVSVARVLAAILHIYDFIYGRVHKSTPGRRSSQRAREDEETRQWFMEFPVIVENLGQLDGVLKLNIAGTRTGAKVTKGKIAAPPSPQVLARRKMETQGWLDRYENAVKEFNDPNDL